MNPWYTAEEISRQFISSQPKAVYCLVNNFDVIKRACSLAQLPNTKIIVIKNELNDTYHSDMISFNELIDTKGE